MKHFWGALLFVLAYGALSLQEVGGQGAANPPPTNQRIAGSLGRNTPNPFNPTTTIPFGIGMAGNPPACTDPSRRYRVTLTIHDVTGRVAGIPIIQGGDRGGEPVNRLLLGCGDYSAFWDGTLLNTGRKVSSGTYIYVLEVDGVRTSKAMYVAK